MNNQTILVAIIALLIGGIGGYAIADKNTSHDTRGYEKEVANNSSMGMHQMPDGSMMGGENTMMGMNGMDHMMGMMVSSEREFIEGMIPHHQEAVDTAKEVIARGGSTPEIKQLVENIVVAQEAEIAEMKQWYQDWYGEPYADNGEYMPMMRDLSNLSGAEIDRVFLEDMIGHHMGAIMMARSVQPYIERNEIAELTQAIVSSQSAEIAQMRQMLQGL
ncbi:DUF305 domain-containing protein [Candidatus Nomurabacteria bacterium]|nr:DUF305 domain-containing protein [Candidatus Kaiserbacteria bacterium]MCB9810142.1 DUF305 domain-containing protein [Candidatus Nomurabacteria bacterium]MCB9818282.1 DUF305 domain-containing protein [Candidatus Nomurabacteria bacterium]